MKKAFLFVVLFVLSTVCYAQSDFEIASSFMSKKGITLQDSPQTSIHRSASNKPYSIYNGEHGKGFAIVVNGSIIGYSTENSVDVNDINPTLDAIINTCASMPNNVNRRASEFPDWFEPRDVTPIEPILKTKWGQYAPYNNMLKTTGICLVVAYAQIYHYYKAQIQCDVVSAIWDKELNDSVYTELPKTTFNHDIMLDDYSKSSYTEEQAEEVAKLYYYTKHHLTESLIHQRAKYWNLEYWLKTISELNDKYAEIDPHLERKIPLATGALNHAFVIDGRDSQGLYHLNLGWSGGGDGYFAIPIGPIDFEVKDYYSGVSYAAKITYYSYCAPFNWDEASRINPIMQNKDHKRRFYNLSGQYMGEALNGLPKGIYVCDGKKYVVK